MAHLSNVLLYLLCFSLIRVAKFQAAQPTLVCTGANVNQKFAINDGTCRNYFMCVDNGIGLIPVKLSCFIFAVFDSNSETCVVGGQCDQTAADVAPPCYRYGRFPKLDSSCKTYYLCYWDGSKYTAIDNLRCPNELVFSPISETCVTQQTFPCPIIQG